MCLVFPEILLFSNESSITDEIPLLFSVTISSFFTSISLLCPSFGATLSTHATNTNVPSSTAAIILLCICIFSPLKNCVDNDYLLLIHLLLHLQCANTENELIITYFLTVFSKPYIYRELQTLQASFLISCNLFVFDFDYSTDNFILITPIITSLFVCET